ncbi:hypothetical protein [Nocardia nepalensis]|uniref:hypothetical protein n=1 Tax=Nocardia nepalensis TaxID=3375448 RepID=UPI003B66CFEC
MATESGTDTRTDDVHGWGWLENNHAVELPVTGTRARPSDRETDDEWAWLNGNPPSNTDGFEPNDAEPGRGRGLPPKAWAVIGVAAVVAASLVIAGAVAARNERPQTAAPTMTAAPPPSTMPTAARSACEGLTGTVVTVTADGIDPMTRAIAGFEYAYYTQASAEAAMRFLAPEAGILPEPLAAGIASIPQGTRHCVAITPIAETTAAVHVVELRRDGQRIDYLQVINVRVTDSAGAITNIQKQGT